MSQKTILSLYSHAYHHAPSRSVHHYHHHKTTPKPVPVKMPTVGGVPLPIWIAIHSKNKKTASVSEKEETDAISKTQETIIVETTEPQVVKNTDYSGALLVVTILFMVFVVAFLVYKHERK